MNYAQLAANIVSYTGNNSFTTDDLIAFITQTELRIYNAVQLLDLRETSTVNATSGLPTVTLPAGFKYAYSLSYTSPTTSETVFLYNKDIEYIRSAFPNQYSTGEPTHYAQPTNTTILLGPTPNANIALSLDYAAYPESITTAGTTWLGDNFDTVLLYGALVEAYTNMKGEPDLLKKYQDQFESGVLLLKNMVEGKNRQDTYRDAQIRYPVK